MTLSDHDLDALWVWADRAPEPIHSNATALIAEVRRLRKIEAAAIKYIDAGYDRDGHALKSLLAVLTEEEE